MFVDFTDFDSDDDGEDNSLAPLCAFRAGLATASPEFLHILTNSYGNIRTIIERAWNYAATDPERTRDLTIELLEALDSLHDEAAARLAEKLH